MLAVAFTIYLCPGAVSVLGLFNLQLAKLPDSAKPALAAVGVCEARPALELYDPARWDAARERVRVLGKPAQMYRVQGGQVSGPLVDWKTTPEYKEIP